MPLTMPDVPAEAMLELLLVQAPPGEDVLSVETLPAHINGAPLMAPGSALMVSTAVVYIPDSTV